MPVTSPTYAGRRLILSDISANTTRGFATETKIICFSQMLKTSYVVFTETLWDNILKHCVPAAQVETVS